MITISGARVVTPTGIIDNGWVRVSGGRILAVGSDFPDAGPRLDLAGDWLLPGFIDLHVHGGGGYDSASSIDAMAAACAFHRSHGTTRTLISLAAAPVPALREQLGWIAELTGPQIVGAHVEGPFLAPTRSGAQNPANLLTPDRAVLRSLFDAAHGTLRVMTIAAELVGAARLIAEIAAEGSVAAVGHSDATYVQAAAGFAAGATLATHLFNGMPPMHHREPGVVGAALAAGVACEVINDGEHLHPAVVRLVADVPDRLVLVTDAMSAAGSADGEHLVAGQRARVTAGQVRLESTGALAGSTLTMDAAVRRAVHDCGLSIEQASAAASANPARVLGLQNTCGQIAPGSDADLVALNSDLRVKRVMIRGEWVLDPPT